MKYFIFLFSVLISSCRTYTYWEPKLNNTVTFDPAFTPHQKEVITQGLNVWTRDTGGRVNFTEVANNANIHIISGTEAEAEREDQSRDSTLTNVSDETIGLSFPSEGLLYLYLDRILDGDEGLLQVSAHEAGHQIGLIHVPQSQEALMDPDLNENLIGDTHLTHYDILQFCDYWGCQDENPTKALNN